MQIELASGAVSLFDQVLDMARLGIIPAGSYRNEDFFGPRVTADDGWSQACWIRCTIRRPRAAAHRSACHRCG